MRQGALVPAVVLVLGLWVGDCAAAAESAAAFDRRIVAELRVRDAAAADTMVLADAARDNQRHREAAALYARVAARVPDYSHALRRQAGELIALDLRREGVRLARAALAIEQSSENVCALVWALSTPDSSGTRPPAGLLEATSILRRARAQAPNDPDLALLSCGVAISSKERDWLVASVADCERLCPQDPRTAYYHAIECAIAGDRRGALRQIERGKSLGLPDSVCQSLMGALEKSRSPIERYAGKAGLALVAWLAGFAGLAMLGLALSRATLAASRRIRSEASGRATGLDARLREAYRVILWFCCGYYYLSIPFVLALVLALGGGLIYGMLALHFMPLKFAAIVIVVTLASAWAVVRSLFVRWRPGDPGMRVGAGEQARLWKELNAVAGRVGVRPVSTIFLTPGTQVAVMERGGIWQQLRGRAERCLILGIAVLDGLKLRPLRAILAHEYGHFSNRDTAGGGFALSVNRSLTVTALILAHGGTASWFNPAWLFVNGFHRVFMRMSRGASRLQEVLADRWAVLCYGSDAFREGLCHVVERSIRFEARANATLKEVIEGHKALANLYAHQPATPPAESELAATLDRAMNGAPSPYDSHPRPSDRLVWISALAAVGAPLSPDDRDDAWTLFDDREAVERQFTDVVRKDIRGRHGVEIPVVDAAECTS